MSTVVEALSRASLPAEFLLLSAGVSVSAALIFVGLLITADRERREREKRGRGF